jgi:hypothetical protein
VTGADRDRGLALHDERGHIRQAELLARRSERDPADVGDEGHRQGGNRRSEPGTGDGRHHQREQDGGEGKGDVEDPRDHAVEPAAPPRRRHGECDAEGGGDDGHDERAEQRGPRTPHEAGEDIAPVRVGAERMVAAWRGEGAGEIDVGGVGDGEDRGGERHEAQRADHCQ